MKSPQLTPTRLSSIGRLIFGASCLIAAVVSPVQASPFSYSSLSIGVDIDDVPVSGTNQTITRQSTSASFSKDLGNGWYGLAGLGYGSYSGEVYNQNTSYRLKGSSFSISGGIGRYFNLTRRLDLYGDTQLQHRSSESEIQMRTNTTSSQEKYDDTEITLYGNTGLRWLVDDSGRLELNPAIGGYSSEEDSDTYAALRAGWLLNRNTRLVIGYTRWQADNKGIINYSLNLVF